MFASQTTKTVDIEGITVVIRKLSWKSLRNASEKHTEGAMAVASKVTPDMMRILGEMGGKKAAADASPESPAPQEQTDPLARYRVYDMATVLVAGIKSWSSEKKLPDGIEDLDTESAEKLFREIIDLSIPTPEQEAAARKNG